MRAIETSMSVLLLVRPKCMLTASHAAPWWVTVSRPTGQTDGRTSDRYTTRSARRGQHSKWVVKWFTAIKYYRVLNTFLGLSPCLPLATVPLLLYSVYVEMIGERSCLWIDWSST